MAFDKTLPANSTKIRRYPTVLNDNFAAIQEGDDSFQLWQANFIDRDLVPGAPPPSQDPTRIDDTMIIYSKQNDDGETDLFILDDRTIANIMQLTQDGHLGSTNTSLNAKDLSFDVDSTTGMTYSDGQLITAYGKFNSGGTLLYGKNMATAGTPHPSTGLFNVNVNADVLKNANYIISGNVSDSSGSGSSSKALMPLLTPAPVAATATTIQVEIKRSGGRTNTFDYFMIMICGGR